MFRRMLSAPDLAAASHLTLACVAGWRYPGIANVTLAQVHSIGYAAGAAGPGVKLRADHAPTLERQAQRVRDAGVGASRRLESGVPYLGIQRFAREEGAEAVILGSHGSSWIKEICLGFTADAILRHSSLPVLVRSGICLKPPANGAPVFCGSLFGKEATGKLVPRTNSVFPGASAGCVPAICP